MSTDANDDAQRALTQLARLSVLTEALAKARTPEELATILVENGELALEAAVSSFVRVEGDELVRLAIRGLPAEHANAYRRFTLDTRGPSSAAVRTGKAIWVESAEEYRARFTVMPGPLENVQAACAIPLCLDERCTGAFVFLFTAPRTFSQAERTFMETFARQAALALERTEAHVRELAYQRRLEELAVAERRARHEADLANQAKDAFLATVSHELRTPLNAIMGWAQLLGTMDLDREKTARAIETIERNASAMTKLVEDLLDVSRIVSGKMQLEQQTVDLAGVLGATIDTTRPAADAREIRLVSELDAGGEPMLGDPTRLQQVFWNLLSNAVKFTPEGGTVTVKLRRTERAFEVIVSDDGKGIATDFLPYVFEPFRQEDASHTRTRGGLGLGLAITRQLVELHGGTVTAENNADRGATFRVTLPKTRS